jgi:hypothetical protein
MARRAIEVTGTAQQFTEHVRGPALILDSTGGVSFSRNLFQQRPDRNRVGEPGRFGKGESRLDPLCRRRGRSYPVTQNLQFVEGRWCTTH